MKKIFKIVLILIFIYLSDAKADMADFPIEYQNELNKLKSFYPNWQFKPFNTELDFNEAVYEESRNNKNLVPKYSDYSLKSKQINDYDVSSNTFIEKDNGWVSANKLVVSYFMNPLNFLNEKHIMQFELLGYDENIHTLEGIEDILKGTFMYQNKISYLNVLGDLIETDETYSGVIMEASKKFNISPYFLASKIRQEMGINGNESISGNYPNYQGIYNFYNIGATDGENAIENGLKWAISGTTYNRPWFSPKDSIIGGAEYISSAYINKGQIMGYLQKFNVNKNSTYPLYTHQYMTNVVGATSEAANQFNSSLSLNNLYNLKVFYIPVYKNMPDLNASIILNKEIDEQTGVINKDNVEIKENAGILYNSYNIRLNKGDKVTILGGFRTNSIYDISFLYYPFWYKVIFTKDNKNYMGYIYSKYVDIDSSKSLYKNENYKLDYKINSNGNENIYFESTNMKVAEIDNNGIVIPKNSGNTTINIYVGSKFESINLTIKDNEILADKIDLNYHNLFLTVGSSKQLSANIFPSNATNKTVTWKSSNNNIITISNGKIVAKNPGSAVITATINGKIDKCIVNVSLSKPVINKINSNSYNILVINFNKVNGADGYAIYRSTSLNGTYKYINSTSKNYYIDKNLINKKKYYYKIRSYKMINGKKSFYSYSDSKIGIPILESTTITSISKYSKNKVKINFKKISGATGYYIYRSTSLNGKYKFIKYINNTTYIDRNLKRGKKYYYKIKTYKKVGNKKYYSIYSNIKNIKI